MSLGGMWPAAMSAGWTWSSTIWKVSLAVLPITAFSRSGSLSPGASTTMRLVPWRMMVGSRVPSWSIRRRIISIDCSTALAAVVAAASGAGWSVMVWSAPRCTCRSRTPPAPFSGWASFCSAAKEASSLAGSVMRTLTRAFCAPKPENTVFACCRVRRTSSTRLVACSLCKASVSTSRRR